MRETIVHGRYSILRTLGGGGTARVYLAHDEVLDRDVALKVLRDQYAEDTEFAERFKREARNAASLSHPNIVSVYDRGVDEDGTSYIAMEHVPGGSLKERISQEGFLDADASVQIASQITKALEAAHGRGVIHRDIKPHNILLTSEGQVKVADFGIARASASTSISRTNLVLGTASYMSPEQALGESVDPRSDLYSLGVVLFEMLTGQLPYTADNPVAVSMKHVNESLRPPKEVNPEIPASLDAVVTKLLAKDPADRYQGATELAEDLRRVRAGLPPLAVDPVDAGTKPTRLEPRQILPPPPPPVPARRRRRRSTPWILVSIFLLLALLGGLGWTLSQGTVRVPSVTGESREQAQQELGNEGLQMQVQQQESSPEDAGMVVGQSPESGVWVQEGSRVTVEVGTGPATVGVPEVVNLSYADAEAVLAEAGLAVGAVRRIQSNTVPANVVFEQGYPTGAQVEPGTAVNLGVSSGPPPVPAQPEQLPEQSDDPAQQQQPEGQSQQPQDQQPGDQPQDRQPGEQPQDLDDRIREAIEEDLEDAGIGGDDEDN
ncbi:MAG: Stk1 family PASTA domain-containing Ser/Thr kinase [Rubrobacteraceae bacterium]